MSEIVRKWLERQLGVLFDLDEWNEDVGGLLLARLLNRYELVSEEELNIIVYQGELYESILEYIRQTVNSLGVALTKEDYQNVLNGKGTTATKLYYELYLALHDKDKMDILATRKMIGLNEHPCEKFKIKAVSEHSEQLIKFDNPLGEAISSNIEIIDWYRDRFNSLMEKCKETREEYENYLENKKMEDTVLTRKLSRFSEHIQFETLPTDCESIDFSYCKLLDEEDRAQKLGPIEPDCKVSKRIMSDIKKRVRKESGRRELKAHFQKVLMHDLWDKMLKEQEEHFKNEFTKTLLKQSLYEQQMATALLDIREQRHIISTNKNRMMAYVRAEEEQQLLTKLSKEGREQELERFRYYKEKERKLELHKRLYEIKMQRRAEAHNKLCLQALEDIVDVALYKATFKEYNDEEISRRKRYDLANLFIKQQPIFEPSEKPANIIEYEPNQLDEDIEATCLAEIERQNAMDDLSFEAYCVYSWPWDFQCWYTIDVDKMNLGLNVIGYVIQRLLLAKYPIKPLPPPPAIPRTPVAVCINGLQNLSILPTLSHLLQGRMIKVIEMQDAINYCLSVFKTETTIEYEESALINQTEAAAKAISKEKVKGKKKESKATKKGAKGTKSTKTNESASPVREFQEKCIQTPKLFPCEEQIFSRAGDLGRMAFEVLNLGESLNDHLHAAIFVEYLKSLHLHQGWVLVNYPQTYPQAVVLEETLTSVRVPLTHHIDKHDSIMDVCDIENRPMDEEVDDFQDKRTSKLIAAPKLIHAPIYDTYLTAYIEIRNKSNEDLDEKYFDFFKSYENEDALNRFYEDQGCKYNLYYEQMDFPTIKHLGKLILGDFSIPPKASVEIFTETLKFTEAEWDNHGRPTSQAKKIGEKVKPKKDSPKSPKKEDVNKKKGDKQKSDKSSKSDKKKAKKSGKGEAAMGEDKETQVPEIIEEIIHEEEPQTAEIKAGELNWIYVNLSIPVEFENALATLWENAEMTYINDFKQLLFQRRTLLDSLVPYNRFLYLRIDAFISRPDNKQDYLHKFQLAYNDLDDDMREDDEVKAELHCRVQELREKLWKICDDRMMENEAERQSYVSENWLTHLLYSLVNIFIHCMQLEMDRCADTLKMLIDYYNSIITKMPCMEEQLSKIKLKLIVLPQNVEDQDHLEAYINFITNIMVNRAEPNYDDDCPFHGYAEMMKTLCLKQIASYKSSCMHVGSKIVDYFNPKKAKELKGAKLKPLTPEPDVIDRASDIMQEYKAAWESEIMRVELRINIIVRVLCQEIDSAVRASFHTFHAAYEDIKARYHREIDSINNACSVLSRAIEAESKIQPELILMNDKFYIKLETLLYEGPLPDERIEVDEKEDTERFTIMQLDSLVDIFTKIAPNGQIPERAFTYLLQDMLVSNAEDGKPPLVPQLWKRMHSHMVHKLMENLFGNTEFIDWKDFIIYNLNVAFPTEQDLLDCRLEFRLLDLDANEYIYEHQYNQVKFWFETGCDAKEMRRIHLIRDLLKRLYLVDDDKINYSALLLSFCKDEDPVMGFAKALELSMGRLVCWDAERGELHYHKICQMEHMKLEKAVDHRDTEIMAEEIVYDLLTETVNQTSGLYIKEEIDNVSMKDVIEYNNEIEMVYKHVSVKEDVEEEEIGEEESDVKWQTSESETRTSTTLSVFTNPSQGFEEAVDSLIYYLPFDALINILTAAIPWIGKVQSCHGCSCSERVAHIYNACIDNLFKQPLIHRFLNNPHFVDILESTYKFQIKDPINIIHTIA